MFKGISQHIFYW